MNYIRSSCSLSVHISSRANPALLTPPVLECWRSNEIGSPTTSSEQHNSNFRILSACHRIMGIPRPKWRMQVCFSSYLDRYDAHQNSIKRSQGPLTPFLSFPTSRLTRILRRLTLVLRAAFLHEQNRLCNIVIRNIRIS